MIADDDDGGGGESKKGMNIWVYIHGMRDAAIEKEHQIAAATSMY